ncbi:TonB-dependent receptor plug domain-containing protein [Prevotella sp. tc2-28]|uniref:TonB-dependent receptor plug domain-containing protein n=1 Tax=Prevotella sp. tc2-28 TaxID=1761888 RepID=UPI003510912E
MKNRAVTIVVVMFLTVSGLWAQQPQRSRFDSIQHVNEVVVTARYNHKEVIPSQTLTGEQLEKLSSHSVADALRYFSGLQLKDYGGVGGIKTVNIRSMGTNHLGISYDGIELGNAQNGQIDLGQFSLDNVEEITLFNGQKSALLQPASDFGHAGSVYIRTRAPRFREGKNYNLQLKAKYGSSDLFRFSTLWEQRLSRRVSSSLSAEVLTSSGKYKFRYRRKKQDGTVAYDTTAIRQNGDIWSVRAEGNLHGIVDEGFWKFKVYTYHSERGIPGAIVNNVWRRGERQWDHNTFLQGRFQKSFGERFTTQAVAKYAYYNTRYVNRDTTLLMVDNTYKQQELYFSTSNVYQILPEWSASLSYDFRWNKLDADMRQFVYPERYSNYLSLATAVNLNWLKAQGSILMTTVKDHIRRGLSQPSKVAYTPAFFLNVYPFASRELSLRLYAKKSFRMPTFNDLYYTDMGNALLTPETTLQYNAGLSYDHEWNSGLVRFFHIQADAYYNSVHDKIVAYPKGQQFRWTMLNLGKVHIKGVDVETELTLVPVRGLLVTGRLQYTYQQARDVTNPQDAYYEHQIPYIPWHSGSAILNIQYYGWDLNYSFIYAGERYNQQENIKYNYMQPWYTSDLSLAYQWPMMKTRWRLMLEVNNLFSQDYDVILNYPMPKRNYGITLDVKI